MNELPFEMDPDWKLILERLSKIRLENDYSIGNAEFIRTHLTSFDDRIRGGAALAATGCLFEPNILDLVIDIAETDGNVAIRKAALQSLSTVIYEGVMQGLEESHGADTFMDDAEEWEEFQTGGLKEDYLRVKHLLLNVLEDEIDLSMQELALSSLADLGFQPEIREKIAEFFHSERQASRLIALHAMGKFPQYWIETLAEAIQLETPVAILKEAISAAYSSRSGELSRAIEGILTHKDPEVLRFAILTLSNINLSDNLGDILQHFSLHENSLVQEAAKDGIELMNQQNFQSYLSDDLGMDAETDDPEETDD